MNATSVERQNQKAKVMVVTVAVGEGTEVTAGIVAASEVAEVAVVSGVEIAEAMVVEVVDTKWAEGETTEKRDVAGHTEDLWMPFQTVVYCGVGVERVRGEVCVCTPFCCMSVLHILFETSSFSHKC